jgi:2-dehydro-3-deoxygalactonokinase
MRFVAVDWGTTRLRAMLVDGDRVLARAASQDGVSRLRRGEHQVVFMRACGAWLAAEPDLEVALVGMVGSREGWLPAPYAACPAGPGEVAAALTPVGPEFGFHGAVVPGLLAERAGSIDVMRGEETHLLGTGVADGLVCLPGTHCKWALMESGRIVAFATFLTGELYALLREHSMVGRPAADPADEDGFALGLAAAGGEVSGGLLNRLFEARAATVTGRLQPAALGPYLSGLLTGEEVGGALRLFGRPSRVTIVADEPRAGLYVAALGRAGVETSLRAPEPALLAGLARILGAR